MKDGFYYIAMDEMPRGPFATRDLAMHAAGLHPPGLAFDKAASVRSYDLDGRLRVQRTPISKANVCPYWGREIPDADKLGLDPNKQYSLLRDPEELAKAAATFNSIQLLIEHIPVDANDHQPDAIVGTTGTDAEFVAPYLYNSLTVWARDGIEAVESKDQQELSSAYRYRADMTPGVYEGIPYDGVMRDINGNHVALVKAGRAGADVVVGDSQLQTKEITMSKKVLSRFAVMAMGSTAFYLGPKLAADAKIDLTPIFDGVSAKNFKEKKPAIVTALKAGVKLAQDASLDDVTTFLDKLESCEVAEGADADPSSGLPMTKEAMAAQSAKDAKAARDEFLKGKLSAKDKAAYDAMFGEKEEAEEKKDEESAKDEFPEKKDDDKVDKKAMDTAIAAAVTHTRKQMTAANEAREIVAPWAGKLPIALDSADDIYKAALDTLGVKVDGVHPSAFKAILEAQPKPGDRTKVIAQDAAELGNASGFQGRWGDQVKHIGNA